MAHHPYEEHDSPIYRDQKFCLKNFYVVANVLYYIEDSSDVFNLAGGKKIGTVVSNDRIPMLAM